VSLSEVVREKIENLPLGLLGSVRRGVHGQVRHIGAHRAARFRLEDNGISCCHSSPASRRMRLANRPTSFFVWTDTQISFLVVG